MSQLAMPSTRPFNNDNMPHFAQFQARLQAAQARQAGLDSQGSAAVALNTPPPRPTQLDDAQAQNALSAVQHSAELASVHNGLDPDRVARLLGLLD
ncbi:MAG: pseudouridine synthase [Desulfovibrionaceae bacterium]